MNITKWISWAGLAAIFGGLIAIILTAPFATAYFTAYPGFDIPPFWLQTVKPVLRPVLSFATPKMVYNIYGRIFELVYLLFLPAVFGLHHLHQGARNRVERWGFRLLVVGLLATFIGVAGDYLLGGWGRFCYRIIGLADLIHRDNRVWFGHITEQSIANLVCMAANRWWAGFICFPNLDRAYSKWPDISIRLIMADYRMEPVV